MEGSKVLKKRATGNLKRHYLLFVVLIAISVLLGTTSLGMLDIFRFGSEPELSTTTRDVLNNIINGDIGAALDSAAGNRSEMEERSVKIGDLEIGHQDGIFSQAVNSYASGSIFATVASICLNMTGSETFVSFLFAFAAFFIVAVKVIFISQPYRIIYTRMILEGRIYSRVDTSTLIFLIRAKKWMKVSLAYLRRNIRMFLWGCTIVGGVIKHYSYAMTEYILAENPQASGKEAIALSRRMMHGHKWELFCLDLSFLGWDILSVFTFGLLQFFYVAPIKEAARAEFFVSLRELSLKEMIPGTELFIDKYIYEKADVEDINLAYSDIIRTIDSPKISLKQPSRIRAFFQDTFGVVLWYDLDEQRYRDVMTRKADLDSYKYCVAGEEYPARLCPVRPERHRISFEHTHFMRHYSVTSLILIFFSFCFAGWLWEVAIHIVEDGAFVNRGVLHGPWLPIYGVGALMILTILARFRKTPWLEFVLTIILCGSVEYFGSWALEVIMDGQKWWDYTGYFLNLNGRICAEGLLVFGLAGIAGVYFAAPMIDNGFALISERNKRTLCIILGVLFIADVIISRFYPNTGAGITDYGMAGVAAVIANRPML